MEDRQPRPVVQRNAIRGISGAKHKDTGTDKNIPYSRTLAPLKTPSLWLRVASNNVNAPPAYLSILYIVVNNFTLTKRDIGPISKYPIFYAGQKRRDIQTRGGYSWV